MRPNRKEPRQLAESVVVILSIFIAVTLYVSQSLYEIVAANFVFLSFSVSSNLRLLELVFFLNWLPALLGFAVWELLRRFSQKWANLYLAAIYTALALAFFFQFENRNQLTGSLFPHAYLLWMIPAVLAGLGWWWISRNSLAFVLLLSPLIIIFPALFLLRTWTDRGIPTPPDRGSQDSGVSAKPGRFFPIILVVLDEFSLPIILDQEAQIDRVDFPNIWELAQQSTWFRNTTTNADHTVQSVPALLTGNFPTSDIASYGVYPQNLFSLLEPYYEIHAYEFITEFCRPALHWCPDRIDSSTSSPLKLYREISFLYARAVVPEELANWLRRRWGPFRDVPGMMNAREVRFGHFLNTLGSLAKKDNFFVFFHHLLPHNPYVLSRNGRVLPVYPGLFPEEPGDDQLVRRLMHHYREQTQYVDTQIGRLVAELKRVGLYDKSLLLVTSDHGVSYLPQAPGRDLLEVDGELLNADLILRVPLFIKLPCQREGSLSDQDVQLIDIVPTITDLLDMQLPWEVVGRNVFDEETKRRAKIAYAIEGGQFEVPADFDVEMMSRLPRAGPR